MHHDIAHGRRHDSGISGAAARGLVVALALVTALVSVGPAEGCDSIPIAARTWQVLHDVRGGAYETTALSESTFQVERTWRGPAYHALLSAYIAVEQTSFCSAQERIEAGQRYLVLIYCAKPEEVQEDGTAVFGEECEAEARAVARSETLLEALRRDRVVRRADLVHELVVWREVPDPGDLHAWLEEASEYAQVDDWQGIDERGDAYSLTGLAIEGLRELVGQVLDCDAEEPRAELYLVHLRDTIVPVVIELLEAPSIAIEQAEALEGFFLDFEIDC